MEVETKGRVEERRTGVQPKRIAAVAYTHYSSDPRVRRETEVLAGAAHDVDVFVLAGNEAFEERISDRIRIIGIPLARYRGDRPRGYLGSYASFMLKAGYRLTRRHTERRYDLVQIHTMPDLMVLAALWLKLSGVPVILDVHDQMPEIFLGKFNTDGKDWKISLLYLSERFSALLADRVLTPTRHQAQRLRDNRVPGDKLVVIHNLPDPKIFGLCGGLIDAHTPGLFRITYHGTLAHRLGLKLALEGLARYRSEMDREGPWRLDILGGGDAREEFRRFTREVGLDERVTFSDGFVPVESLKESLRGSCLGIVPNLAQPDTDLMLPTKLIEYLYLGIPAMTTPTKTVVGYLEPDQVTYVAKPDPDSWGRAIVELRRDSAKRREQAVRGLDFFREHSWEREAERFLGVVEELTGQRR